MNLDIKSYNGIRYVISYPDGYDSAKKYPVILFFHGAGTRDTDISVLTNCVSMKAMQNFNDFIVVAPKCDGECTWYELFSDVIKLVEEVVINADFTDKSRVYCMGVSMGGYAAWQIAMSRPEWFAAIVPICGGGMAWNTYRLKDVPVWAFHCNGDPTVNVAESIRMTEGVNYNGGNALLTIYEKDSHDAWTETVNNEEVYKWFLQHKKTTVTENTGEFSDPVIYG